MDFVFGLLASLLFPATPKTTPVAAPPAVTASAVQKSADDLKAAALTPPLSAEEIRRARAAVQHATEPQEGGRVLHRFTFPDGAVVEFPDQPRRPRDQARRERVVFFMGTQGAKDEPASTFEAAGRAAGLSEDAIQALRYISRHEGGFDAINTWDRARFSWGFIQFAGGYGLRPALAHFKAASPALFRDLMASYGIDVTQDENGRALPLFVQGESGALLRGNDAEQAYGDDLLAIACFVRAGRVTEVKQRQVEAAIRDYASPALKATYEGVKLVDVLRSPQAIAMLFDRQVHEGNVSRLEWALEHARSLSGRMNPADWPALESSVLDLAVQDAEARTSIAELSESTADSLERAAAAARDGQTQLVFSGPSFSRALAGLAQLQYEADYRMVTSYRRDELRQGFASLLGATEPNRVMALPAADMARELEAAARKTRDLTSSFRFEYAIRNRLKGIRTSDLPGPGSVVAAR